MHAVTTLFVWMCLGGSALAHHNHEPCDPPSMSGFMSVIDLKGDIKAMAEYSYDSMTKKLHFKDNDTHPVVSHFNRTSPNMDVLMLFGEGVFYEIDNKNQSCEKKALQVLAHPFEVPSDAMYMAELSLGSVSVPGEGLKVNTWGGAVSEIKSRYSITTTPGGCLTLSTLFFGDSTTLLFTNTNVVAEIKDPDVFAIPAFCESVELEETPEGTVNSFFGLFT